MTSILLEGFEPINLNIKDAEQKSIITGVSWEDYEQLLNRLGNSLCYRITYLDGTLEIMSPGGYHAFCPMLKGCHSQGDTFEETLENITEAIELYVESLLEDGENK